MQLWTIQTEEAWQTLNQRGYLSCRRKDIDRDFLPAYNWMASQMITRIGRPANKISLPLWAWYQCENDGRKRPDLRRSGHLPRGTRGYRIEFEIPDGDVLLSDFESWHFVLNYWYLPHSEHDADNFDARYTSLRVSWQHPPQDERVNRMICSSWDRIFDLNWSDECVAAPTENKSIQATFWQLDWGHVRTADSFIAR